MQDTFHAVFRVPCMLVGASRTDAGVHALGQVARISTSLSLSDTSLLTGLANKLPPSIVIRSCNLIDASFHPQANVQQKIYWYHFFIQRPLPFVQRYGHYVRYPLDIQKLRSALQIFVGTHDFRSFCTGYEHESTVRTVDAIELVYMKQFGVYRIVVRGERFLRYMIRRIVGAALSVATHPASSLSSLQKILDAQNPEHQLPTAPAKGLMLAKILYHS